MEDWIPNRVVEIRDRSVEIEVIGSAWFFVGNENFPISPLFIIPAN